MRVARVVLVALVIVIASLVAPASGSGVTPRAVVLLALPSHAPIDIEGNAGFMPANGVTGGSGTLADPYIISGWSIDSPPAIGVQVRNTNLHAVFRDLRVTNAPVDALYFYNVANISLVNVTAYVNEGEAIRFESSRAFSVVASNLTGNQAGVVLLNSADAVVRDTNLTANRFDGIAVTGSPNVTLEGNQFLYNGFNGGGYGIDLAFTTDDTVLANRFLANGIVLTGDSLAHFDSHTITPDNLAAGLPILYVKDCNGLALSDMVLGELLLAGCRHARISNLTVAGGDVGIEIAFGNDAVVGPGVLVTDSPLGIELVRTSLVRVVESQVLSTAFGVQVDTSTDVGISGTKISAPFSTTGPYDGVVIRDSDLVNVTGDIVRHRRYALAVSGSGNVSIQNNVVSLSVLGLNVSRSHDLHVAGNLFSQDTAGLRFQNVTNATLSGNGFLALLTTGANISASTGIEVVHNAFGGVRNNAYDGQVSSNGWDGGYPAGGNFWGNYHGIDLFHGPGQNLSGPDGIGDTPYLFDVNAVDRYPLMVTPITADVPPEALFVVAFPEGYVITPFRLSANLSSDLEDPLSVLQVRWFWDDNVTGTPWTTTKYTTHVFGTAGVHSIHLEVRDTAGLRDDWTSQVLVLAKPDGLPPAILSTPPGSVEIGQSIPITANITDPSGIANATLLYQTVDGGSFQSIPMQIESNGTNFTATIPPQPHAGTVAYVIVANDTWANEGRAPLSGVSMLRVVDPLTSLILGGVLAVGLAATVAVVFVLLRRRRSRTLPTPPPGDARPPPGNP
jgi:nitrous oxidase accessory protein NosD